jgi:hypothetical protein
MVEVHLVDAVIMINVGAIPGGELIRLVTNNE